MILVELLLYLVDIELILCFDVPGKLKHSVEIAADNARLLRGVGHLHEFLRLADEFFCNFVREVQRPDLLYVAVGFFLRVVALAELLVDCAELLAEVIFALVLVDLLFDLLLNVDLSFDYFDLVFEHGDKHFHAAQKSVCLKQSLLVLDLEHYVENYLFEKLCAVFLAHYSLEQFAGHSWGYLRVLCEGVFQRAYCGCCGALGKLHAADGQFLHLKLEVLLAGNALYALCACETLHKHSCGAVRSSKELAHLCDNADLVDVRKFRLGLGRVLLGYEEDSSIALGRRLDSVNGAFPSDVEVKHHSREYNKPPEGDGRDQLVGCFSCVAHIFMSPFSCFIFV